MNNVQIRTKNIVFHCADNNMFNATLKYVNHQKVPLFIFLVSGTKPPKVCMKLTLCTLIFTFL